MADLTTLANAKQWLGITSSADDALLTRLISAASDYIQTWLNRTIASQAYSEVRDGPGGSRLMFSNYPVTAVASVKVDGITVPQSTTVLVPGWVSSGTSLAMRGGWAFSSGLQNVEISYTAGFAIVPNEIEQAAIELVGLRYKDKDRIGVTSKTLAGETISYSQKDFSDSVETTLKNYKKVISL